MGWRHWIDHASAYKKGLASVAVGMAVALAGVAISLPASAGIASTKHNLGSGGTGTNTFSGTAEICVFCHTPHGADTSAAVPLWNRILNTTPSTTYQTYDSLGTSSLDGKVVTVGSVSIACLSCHDGTQAMNTVINAPGSGGYNAAGADMAGTWTGANQTAGKLNSVANLSTDLRNDHPIGIQYAGGGITQASASLAAGADPDFVAATKMAGPSFPVWYVDTGTAGRQKTDMLLYSRAADGTAASSGNAQPFVECASCHDPHTETATFLRIANTGSAVCLACHVK